MPIWLILALGSVIVLTVSEIAQKFAISSKDNISAEANNFVVWNIQGLMALIFFIAVCQPNLSSYIHHSNLKTFCLGCYLFLGWHSFLH